jgi:hypothetical protein
VASMRERFVRLATGFVLCRRVYPEGTSLTTVARFPAFVPHLQAKRERSSSAGCLCAFSATVPDFVGNSGNLGTSPVLFSLASVVKSERPKAIPIHRPQWWIRGLRGTLPARLDEGGESDAG